jgi:hypothetical protein
MTLAPATGEPVVVLVNVTVVKVPPEVGLGVGVGVGVAVALGDVELLSSPHARVRAAMDAATRTPPFIPRKPRTLRLVIDKSIPAFSVSSLKGILSQRRRLWSSTRRRPDSPRRRPGC